MGNKIGIIIYSWTLCAQAKQKEQCVGISYFLYKIKDFLADWAKLAGLIASFANSQYKIYWGPFNNYVDKKGGGGSAKSPRLSTQGRAGLWMSTWTKIWKKGIEKSWQILIKNKVFVFLCVKSSVIGDKVDKITLNWT